LENPVAAPEWSDYENGISVQLVFGLVAILRGWLNPGQDRKYRSAEGDLDGIVRLAIATKTLGLLRGGFERSGTPPPPALSNELTRRHAEILQINLRALSTISKIAKIFEAEDLAYAVIKGPLRAEQVYGAMDVRFGSDVDVFVDKSDYRPAMRLLEERLGYSCLVPEDDRWWHDYLGESPLAPQDESAMLIDLHNQLQQPGGPYPSDARSFLQDVDHRQVGRASTRILTAENALMLTAISFGKAKRNAEPWIAYAHEVCHTLNLMPPSAEKNLRMRAREIRIGRLFDEFLQSSKTLFEAPIGSHSAESRKRLAMSACGLAPLDKFARSKASWRWTEGTALSRLGRFGASMMREARGRMAYRTSMKFD
jgi:hypothetical protein